MTSWWIYFSWIGGRIWYNFYPKIIPFTFKKSKKPRFPNVFLDDFFVNLSCVFSEWYAEVIVENVKRWNDDVGNSLRIEEPTLYATAKEKQGFFLGYLTRKKPDSMNKKLRKVKWEETWRVLLLQGFAQVFCLSEQGQCSYLHAIWILIKRMEICSTSRCYQEPCNFQSLLKVHTFYLVFAPAVSVIVFNFETDQREAPTTSATLRWCVRAATSPCIRGTCTNSSSCIGARDTASRK